MPKDPNLEKLDPLIASIKTRYANLLLQGVPKSQLQTLSLLEKIEKSGKKRKKGDALMNLVLAKIECDQLMEGIKSNNLSNISQNMLKIMLSGQLNPPWPEPQPISDENKLLGNAQAIYTALFEIKKLVETFK